MTAGAGGGTREPHSGQDHDVVRCITTPTAEAIKTHASRSKTLHPDSAAPIPNRRLKIQNETISPQNARRGGTASMSSPQAEQYT